MLLLLSKATYIAQANHNVTCLHDPDPIVGKGYTTNLLAISNAE